MFFSSCVFFLIIMATIVKSKNLLSLLINIEMAALIFFLMVLLKPTSGGEETLNWLYYIVAVTMESALGLVLFVTFVSYWGKDYLLSFSLVKF